MTPRSLVGFALIVSACGSAGPPNGGPSPTQALIVLAPHPDDESAIGAATVHRFASDQTMYVRAIYLSGGDRATFPGDCNGLDEQEKIRQIVALREDETRGAWGVIAPDRGIALDFLRGPDQRLVESSTFVAGVHEDVLTAAGAQAQKRAVELASDVPRSVKSVRIITTSIYDAHPDHRTAYHAAQMAAERLRAKNVAVQIWSWIVHDEIDAPNPTMCCAGDFHWPGVGPHWEHDTLLDLPDRPRPPKWDHEEPLSELAELRGQAFVQHRSQVFGNPQLCMYLFIADIADRWGSKLEEPFYREGD